jgi:pimeloyl-[acyl-carrier protein] methyl ester esterase
MITDAPAKSTVITLVFIHGWGMNSGVFSQLIEAMKELEDDSLPLVTFDYLSLDLPGHGAQQDTLPSPYELQSLAEAISSQIPENSVLIGWSLGGLVAQYLAAHQHPNIKALITIASTPKFQMSDDWPGIKPEVLSMFTEQLSVNHHKTLSRFLAIQMMGVDHAKALIKQISASIEALPSPNPIALSAGLKILQDADLRADISQISVPTLRLYGRLDSLVPHAAINQIQHLQPNSQTLIFKHASHAPFLTDAKIFAQHLHGFISTMV